MVATRRSQADSGEAPAAAASDPPAAGTKRSGGQASQRANKAQKKEGETRQQTIEETLGGKDDAPDAEMRDATPADHTADADKPDDKARGGTDEADSGSDEKKSSQSENKSPTNGKPPAEAAPAASKSPDAREADAVRPSDREDAVPWSILEKGLMYIFTRARVNVDAPSSPSDLARSYLVLRPLPHGAALAAGPAATARTKHRVLALPKKVLPRGPQDRFMVFVDQAGATAAEVESAVLRASDYTTQTMGERHAPAATPVAEGVYALTDTGAARRETHLAYALTLPRQLGAVQRDIGLEARGSFVLSAKNPKFPGPAYTQLPKAPDYSQEILDGFGSLRWSAATPDMLDCVNAQFLLIGSHDADLSQAGQVRKDDDEAGKEEPKEEIEKLEAEDHFRVEKLSGDHAVFADLGLSGKEYEGLKTTW